MNDRWVVADRSAVRAAIASLLRHPATFFRNRLFRTKGVSRQYDVPVSTSDVLDRLLTLPISTWSYGFDDASVRHLGPMAQDFAQAFGLGDSDEHIYPVDGIGVALASIQALHQRIAELEQEIERLKAMQ